MISLNGAQSFDIKPWADRVPLMEAQYDAAWELPAMGVVPAPAAVLVRPDGYVAWVGDENQNGLTEALIKWFGPPSKA